MSIDERIVSELRRHAPEVDEQVAWDRIRSAVPARRRTRAIRLVAVSVAALGFLVLGFVLLPTFSSGPDFAGDPPSPFLGTWVALTTDSDGSTATMVIGVSEGESVEMLVHDDNESMCSGVPATMTGTGGLEGENVLAFSSPVLTCDDGSQPVAEQLQNFTLTYDPQADTLTDNLGSVWTRVPSEVEVTELLNGFLEARIAGDGAHEYLNVPKEGIPLLYATTSGASYERAEFEPVVGIEWPYGFMAFKVRLFAGDTVVEQLFFTPHDDPIHFPADGRLGLEYDPHGFGTDIAPTTEDGQPVALPYSFFDGEVILHAAHPWVFRDYPFGPLGRLIPEGPGVRPTTDGGERADWDEFRVMADPAAGGTGCQTESPADAEALAESIRSYPGLEATAPVAVSAGGVEGLMMDVTIAAGRIMTVAVDEQHDLCANGLLNPILDQGVGSSMTVVTKGVMRGQASGERMRLYLFDMPEELSMRTMAIAIVSPESRFARAVEAAAPVVDSVEFHAP